MHNRREGEACAASGEAFRAVFEHALDAMLIADGEGRCADANPAAGALLGLTKDELIGRSTADFVAAGTNFHDMWVDVQGQGAKRAN
jgi:PAS domain S-box-containing protein